MVLQHKLRPSIARVNVQLDPRHAASKHTTAPINHTRPSPRKHSPDVATCARKQTSDCSLLLIYRPRTDERLSWPGWLFTYRSKVSPPGVEPRHVTHPSTNRARHRVTSLIRPTPLPLCHAAMPNRPRWTSRLIWIVDQTAWLYTATFCNFKVVFNRHAQLVCMWSFWNLVMTWIVKIFLDIVSFIVSPWCWMN